MLVGLARSEIEVVEPLPSSSARRLRRSSRPSEAMQWLNAHHAHSPITRHALVVLESIDAVDLAFDTFVCALLDGEVDTSGYPEYNAIVGGVAAHWDEATGDMICRAVVGWGGKGVRGDTDRIGAKLLGGLLNNILASQYAHGPDRHRATRAGRRAGRPGVRALRVRLGPRAGVLLPEVRHAPAARLRRNRIECPCTTTTARMRPAVRGGPRRPRAGADALPELCGGGPVRKAITAAAVHFKGSGWAKKERRATVASGVARKPTTGGPPATARRRTAARSPATATGKKAGTSGQRGREQARRRDEHQPSKPAAAGTATKTD